MLKKHIVDNFFDTIPKYKARDAIRLGIQTAIAAATLYAIMEALTLPEKFVGVLSAVLVIETSVGASIGNSGSRFLATISGCVIGLASLYIMPTGYGVIGGLIISMFVMNGISVFKPSWRYGVVAAVALAINQNADNMTVALDRSLAIGLGVVVGTIASVIIWPEKSSTRAWRNLRIATGTIADYLDQAIGESVSEDEDTDFSEFANKYSTHISSARSLAAEIKIADKQKLLDAIDVTEKLYHSVVMIQRISGRTNNVHDGSDDIHGVIDSIRELFCDAAGHIANSKGLDDFSFEKLDDEITKLKDQLGNTQPDDETFQQNAFVFAVMETRDSLHMLRGI